MTTENIEKKVTETVAENKETIAQILKKGTDHKTAVIFASAGATALAAFGFNALTKKIKASKNTSKDESFKEMAETVEEAMEKDLKINVEEVKEK